jgi:hypothetical protein
MAPPGLFLLPTARDVAKVKSMPATGSTRCTKGKKEPNLKGKKPRHVCRRCGLLARKKKDLCKPEKL